MAGVVVRKKPGPPPRFTREERKQRNRESWRRSIAKYPERDAARRVTAKAIRNGVLTRQPCAVCGKLPTDAHHEDYAMPLRVAWLCRHHHGRRHHYLTWVRLTANSPFCTKNISYATWLKRMRRDGNVRP